MSYKGAVHKAAESTGVLMSVAVLHRFTKENGTYVPGKDLPVIRKRGNRETLSEEIERELAEWLELQDIAMVATTDAYILGRVAAVIKGTPFEAKFKNGLPSKGWLARFRKRHNFTTSMSRPLDGKRAEWRQSENAWKMCSIYEDLLVEKGIAMRLPNWDATKPRMPGTVILHPDRIVR